MSNDDITPVRQQYLEIKRNHPNEILFFRLGDFYETVDEDAEIAAQELDKEDQQAISQNGKDFAIQWPGGDVTTV